MKKYSQLLRLEQPVGFFLLMLPCFWGVIAASDSYHHLWSNFYYFIVFAIGSIVMRSAGCIINDFFDRDIDKFIARTSQRPLASGAISYFEAFVIFLILNLIGLAILLSLNLLAIIIGLLSFVLFIFYPLMKRITYWPQLFLGITFNIGCLISYASIENQISIQIICLYLAGIFWTLGYDTIYAHQDRKDDLDLGIKSTAILFGNNTNRWLIIFYSLMMIFLFIFGLLNKENIYYFILLIFVGMHLFYQIKKLNIDNKDVCLKIFKSNQYLGLIIAISLLIGTL